MANFRTSEDCFNYIYNQVGDTAGTTRFADQAAVYLNMAHRELVSGVSRLMPEFVATFPWAKAINPKNIILKPAVTGTADLTNDSTSITFTSAPSDSLADYHIVFTGDNVTYKISSHTASSTSATLDSVCLSTTASAVAYTAYKLEYSVGSSDILRVIDAFQGFEDNGNDSYKVFGVEESDFFRHFRSVSQGEPTNFCVMKDDVGTLTVRFNKYPSAARRLNVPYIPIPSDLTNDSTSVPLVSLHHRQTMCDMALFYLFDIKDDQRADKYLDLAMRGYRAALVSAGYKDADFKPYKNNVEIKEKANGQ